VTTVNLDYQARRFYVLSGGPPTAGAPSAGGTVHGVSGDDQGANQLPNISPNTRIGYARCPGYPFLVETGGAFSAGGALKTDANGKAIAQGGSGTIVATALEDSSGSGLFKWAVFT